MELSPPQSKILSDTHRFRVLNIGRRGGKTTLAIEEMKDCAFARPARVCYIAPTYQQARDIAWSQLKDKLLPIAISINEARLEIRVRTQDGGESWIILRGWESIETLRGQFFDFIVLDEVAMMRNFWLIWQEVIRPTLTDRKGQALFISTPKGFNHFYDLFNMESKDPDYKSFHFTSYDNPHIPKEEIDKAKEELTPDRFAQEYMADFRKTEGLVYKEFSREKHCYDELPHADYEYIAGIDFGYTNPAAVLHVYFAKEQFWIDDEWYKRGRTDRQIAEYAQAAHFDAVYPDPENPGAIEELRNLNVNIREVVKGKNSVQAGVQRVREALLAGKIHINKRCLNLIHEFESYTYDDQEADVNAQENPIKANDHALDALRYVVRMKREAEAKSSYNQPPPEVSEFERRETQFASRTHGSNMNVFNNFIEAQPNYQPSEFEQ